MIKIKKHTWFLISLLGVLLAAPNATVIKYSLGSIDPFVFNVFRFFIVSIVTTPFLIKSRHEFTSKNLRHALAAGFFMSVAVISYTWAIKLSQASYVSIVTLLTPIIFVLLAARLTGEKITNRSIAGISLAAAGAFIIVFLPLALKQSGEFVFFPLATAFVLVNCFAFPLSIINYKQANEGGISILGLMSLSSWIILMSNLLFVLIFGWQHSTVSGPVVFGILYSGAVVALISRVMHIVSYEHIGSAIISILQYLETFIAILLPILILGEKLSVELVVGGVLILAGVYVVEHHKSAHHRHHHYFRSH